MIIKITNKCEMGCNHCMMNSTSNGEHMSFETFEKAIEFIKNINPMVLMISGGEPTLHPNFFDMLDKCTNTIGLQRTIVASNGMFLSDKKLTKKLMNRKVNVQITNDKRFYPREIEKIDFKKFLYEHNIRQVTNHGRAKLNKLADLTIKPKCYNMISVAKKTTSLKDVIAVMEGQFFKFCGLSVNWDGTISIGESIECQIIGTLDDSLDVIFNNLKNLNSQTCNKCGGYGNLNPFEKINLDI